MSRKQSGKPVRGHRKCELERKRDERAARRAMAKDRKNQPPGEYETEEFVSFSNQLKALGLELREVPGDGNCLFRALADQLEGHSRGHLRLRKETVQFMMSHRQDFEPFVEDDVPFNKHVSDLAEPGTFAGNDAIVAFARSQEVKVVIHQLNTPLWEINGSEKPLCQELHIAYRYGDHYDSVRHVADSSESPAHLRIANMNKSRRFGDGEKDKQRAPFHSHSHYDEEDVILNSLKTTTSYSQEDPCQSIATSQKCHAKYLESKQRNKSSPCDLGAVENPKNQSELSDSVCPPESGTTHKPKLSNKQKKEQQRLEKKKRQEERHRQKVHQGRDSHVQNQNLPESVTLVKALNTLSI